MQENGAVSKEKENKKYYSGPSISIGIKATLLLLCSQFQTQQYLSGFLCFECVCHLKIKNVMVERYIMYNEVLF